MHIGSATEYQTRRPERVRKLDERLQAVTCSFMRDDIVDSAKQNVSPLRGPGSRLAMNGNVSLA